MTLTHLADRRSEGVPNPAEVITTTLNGVTFKAGRRTAAHLAWTDGHLRKRGCWLRVIQPCYNSSVAASAGTHDGDGCLDVDVENENWLTSQELLRQAGWAAWYRAATPGLWGDHIHMISIGCPGPVGMYVPGQVGDYYDHLSGLKGHAPDPTWHPEDIDSTVFDYDAWTEDEDMSPEQEDRIVAKVVAAILDDAKVDKDKTVSVRQSLNQTRNDAAKAASK